MAVLIIAENRGQTAEGYDGMVQHMGAQIHDAPGRLMHVSHATPDGWRVIEVWESRDLANRWFAAHVVPILPTGVRPRRTFQDLHLVLAK
jgi:hypothetical protein